MTFSHWAFESCMSLGSGYRWIFCSSAFCPIHPSIHPSIFQKKCSGTLSVGYMCFQSCSTPLFFTSVNLSPSMNAQEIKNNKKGKLRNWQEKWYYIISNLPHIYMTYFKSNEERHDLTFTAERNNYKGFAGLYFHFNFPWCVFLIG